MAGSRIQHNKQHKTRFSSKSSRNAHKVPLKDKHKSSKSGRKVTEGARSARLQRNKNISDQKRADLLKEKRASSSFGSPRVVVLFGLSASVDLSSLENELMGFFSGEEQGIKFPAIVSKEHKLRATILKAPNGNLSACMEMAKVADLIAFVASASSLSEEGFSPYIDSFGSQCLSVFRAVGLPSTAVLIRDLPVESKRRNDLKKTCISSLGSEFPEDCKMYLAETKDELRKFISHLKEHRFSAPHWRCQRPYIMAQEVDCVADDSTPGKGSLVLTGYLRAHALSVNQLIHVSGTGDFQLSKIELLKDPCPLNVRKGGDLMDSDDGNQCQVIKCLTPDPMKQEPVHVENIPDPLAGEQTWPTEAEMTEAKREKNKRKPKRRVLPPGTSEYQSAWIVENSDEDYSDGDDSDDDDDDVDGMVLDNGGSSFPGQESKDFEDDDDDAFAKELDAETETASMVMDDENLSKEQIEDDIRKIKEAHAEDKDYPDEVDTPIDVPARTRFAKYRRLKSLRTSSWDPKESLPPEYARIFAFDNFTRTQKHVIARALNVEQTDVNSYIHPGSYVRLYIKDVPTDLCSKLIISSNSMPVIMSGLLQHESKISVLHFSIKKHDTYTAPIKSKEELTFHVGFRQFVTRPIYSSDTMNLDKSKMERFLHPGRFSIASVYAPISFPPLPLIAFKNAGDEGSQMLAAIGSLRSIDLDRIILKKIILTGYPQRVSKLKATVRYMFHTPEDVRWFKPVEVWTKYGRRGRVKEPVGTHGAMKCIFNGVLQQHDTVCMSLYKRVYPKWPQHWYPLISS